MTNINSLSTEVILTSPCKSCLLLVLTVKVTSIAKQAQVPASICEALSYTSVPWKLYLPKIINIGQQRDTTNATEATPTTSLPSSRKFWYSLTVSNPSSHDRLFRLAFFCSASTQTVLMRMIGTTEYKRHLNLKRSTTNGI